MAGEELLIRSALQQAAAPAPAVPQEYNVTMPDGKVYPAVVAQVLLLGQISDQLQAIYLKLKEDEEVMKLHDRIRELEDDDDLKR